MKSILALVCLAAAAVPAAAQERTYSREDSPVQYSIGFYLWAPDMQGDLTVGGATTEADADFDDLFDNLDSTFGLHFEVFQRQQAGAWFDINWLNIRQEPDFSGGSGSIEQALGLVEVGAAKRWQHGMSWIDFLVGLRWVRLESEIDIPTVGDEENARDYLDPLFGVRVGADLARWLTMSMRVDIGGFGIGTELTGHLSFLLGFQVGPGFDIVTGWKSMSIEIDEDNYDLDLLMRGPILAFNFGF
jgi:hypothetical protein